MKMLHIFDAKNYDTTWRCFKREAVRAIIFRDGKIALVKSEKEGYYKFPGGGIEGDETHAEALVRETFEETGLHIAPQSTRPFGSIIEKRSSVYEDNEIFEQHSHYYFAEISAESVQAELGYHLEFADLAAAWKTNIQLGNGYKSAFLFREAYIMELLMNSSREYRQGQ